MGRFPVMLVVGLVCIVLGVVGSEWSRRHPPEKPAPVVVPAPTPLTPEQLSQTERLPDVPPDATQLASASAELAILAGAATLPEDFSVPEAKAVLAASLSLRGAIAHANALFFVLEEGKQGALQTLVRVTTSEPPKVLAVHRPQLGTIAASGSRLYWSEGGSLFSIDASSGGVAKGLLRFPRARVTSLGVKAELLVATLVPKDLDPFSSEPVGAVVSVSLKDGTVKVLASAQVRPAEAGTDGTFAVWIAGYPSDLWSLQLPDQAPKLLSTRADGPVLMEEGFITFRHPVVGSPELVRMATGAGSRVLAKGEIDRVASSWGDVWFSVGGTVSQVDKFGENEKVIARLPHPVLELAVTDDALYAVTRLTTGGHLLVRLPRSTPVGDRQ